MLKGYMQPALCLFETPVLTGKTNFKFLNKKEEKGKRKE